MSGERLESALAQAGVEVLAEGPLPLACPRDVAETQAVLAVAREQRLRVVPCGLGSKLSMCRPEVAAGHADLLLSTRRMQRVVEHVAGDGTVTAQAGASMAQLAATVAASGHRLTPDVPTPAGATLGGVLGAGLSGIDRLRNGPLRHHVLGVTALLADGTVARSGGRLVKNVTGFDLHRLYTGARGTLCLLLEASMRLFPEPEAELAFGLPCRDLDQAWQRALELRQANLPALALVLETRAEDVLLHLVLAGRRAQLIDAEQRVSNQLSGAERLDGAAAGERRERLRDAAAPAGAWPQLRCLAPTPSLKAALEATLAALGLAPTPGSEHGRARLLAYPACGSVDLFLPELAAQADASTTVLAAQSAAAASGGRVAPLSLPAAVHRACAPSPDSDPARQWMDALTQRFDPEARFACPSFPVLRP